MKATPGDPFDADAATLRIRLKFSDRQATNTLRVEFLQTYENVGTATVWVGDHPATQRIDALDARDRYSTIGSASFRYGKNGQFEGGACNAGSKGSLSAKTCQQATAFRYLDLPAGEGVVNVRLDALDAKHSQHAAVNKFKLVALAACDGKPP